MVVYWMDNDEFIKANKELWENRTEAHLKSEHYDVSGFLKGRETLDPIDIREVGNVESKTLLHLMCHFGLDTLSWARHGADVTGVDISESAIAAAKELAKKANLDAEFIQSNVYNLPDNLKGQFDIVFMSEGVLVWLPDMEGLFQIVSHFLKPGGFLYLRDFHPFFYIFDDESDEKDPQVRYPYFRGNAPMKFEFDSSYASGDHELKKMPQYEWNHPVSSIINGVVKAGLTIQFFNEFPFIKFPYLKILKKTEHGRWIFPDSENSLPMMFSLKAVKN
jgi:SAM-dependent methyltransferase